MKTSLCLKWIAAAQRRMPDKRNAFVDLEGSFSKQWAQSLGVNTESLVYAQPSTAEQAVDLIEALLYADDLGLLVIDSLAAMITQHELDSDAEKAMVGTQGSISNKLYRKTTRAMQVARRAGRLPTLVCINQVRFKVGVMHGDPEIMPGGPSFRYSSSMTLRLAGYDEVVKDIHKTLPAFKEIRVTVRKWKVPIASRNCKFMLATLPVPKLRLNVGDAYDLGSIQHYLKHFELLLKDKKEGWLLRDEHGELLEKFKRLDDMESRIVEQPEFGDSVRALITRVALAAGELIDPE